MRQTHFDEVQHPRDPQGKFVTKPDAEAEVELESTDSAAELLGESSVAPSRWGQVVTVQGPVLYLGASVPEEHADDPEYLDRRWHRLEAFAAQEYGATISRATDDGPVEDVQVSWEVEFEDATPEEADQLVVKARERLLGRHSGVHDLDDALTEGAYERTRFSEDLEEYLRRTDEEAEDPRDLVLAEAGQAGIHYPADLDQESLDYAVQTARENIPIAHRVRRPEARRGSFIAIDDSGRVSVYSADAWTPPSSQPMLPWRAPKAVPVAKVDMDGHASLLSTEEKPCQDCGQPLEDKASPNMRRYCMSCTGEWEDGD